MRQQIVNTALQYVKDKVPYAWSGGGAGVRVSRGTRQDKNVVGVDCSGLVAYSYSKIGVNLPHYSGSQTAMGYRTNIRNAQPGDIVGWNKGGHVAVYIGNGMIAEAPGSGKLTRVRKLGANEAVYAVRLKLQGE
jgi:cell wall-associated NlpC family hydrolase